MTDLRDENIWEIAQGKSNSLNVDDAQTRPLTPVATNYVPSEKNGSPDYLLEKEALKSSPSPKATRSPSSPPNRSSPTSRIRSR